MRRRDHDPQRLDTLGGAERDTLREAADLILALVAESP